MTNIIGVDVLFQAQQNEAIQQPMQDFARELAKSTEQAKHDAQDGANAKSDGKSDAQELSPVTKLPSASSPGVSYETATGAANVPSAPQARAMEEALVMPIGITEALLGARVFGWHALAQAYLSELSVADQESGKPATAEASPASIEDAPVPAESAGDAAPEMASTQDVAEDVGVASGVDAAPQDQQHAMSSDTAPAGAPESIAADAQASGYWAERSLRLVRQRDGGVVAWLRDFRVADADRPALLKAVLHEARAQGLALNKIMLNGREAWSSSINH
jgi:hypothetical protein